MRKDKLKMYSVDWAFARAKERARNIRETMLVCEGAGGYYSIAESYAAQQSDRDRIVAFVYPNGQEMWAS